MSSLAVRAVAALVISAAAAACGGHSSGSIDRTIGAPCTSNTQCDHQCLTPSGDFPGGFCTIPCTDNSECTSDTVCVAKAGGVCLYACPPFDCARLGANWSCQGADAYAGGKVNVCLGN